MQQCLKSAGMRPINNIVDITNFVMLETGQPMHAFDLRDVRGGQIIVRRAKDGETMTTLDGKPHALTREMLVIADGEEPLLHRRRDGRLDSEIKADTPPFSLKRRSSAGTACGRPPALSVCAPKPAPVLRRAWTL